MAEERISPKHDMSFMGSWLIYGALAIGMGSAVAMLLNHSYHTETIPALYLYRNGAESSFCPQVPKLSPENKQIEQYVWDKVNSPFYQEEMIQKLSGIIRIPSESFDNLGSIGEDTRWEIFFQVENYLKTMYPAVFQNVKLDHANTHGLILTWNGSIAPSEAKPILMLAHQDVVPVLAENVKDWTHPPYDGHYDGEIIWGRGATDDKGYLISIIESLDLLIQSGFRPKRTIILAFGCDEEISGENCGRPIANFLYEEYGDDGIYLIMDEGATGIQREYGQSFAMVGVSEKGYLDVGINVSSTGGHASNPLIIMSLCGAIHAPESSFSEAMRHKLGKVAQNDSISQMQLAQDFDDLKYFFTTTQSVGKINGGVKINAIPETASVMVNLRLAVESSIADIKRHYELLVRPIAERHGIMFAGFDAPCESSLKRGICLYGIDALEPAPVSPLDVESFRILSGTIKNVLKPLQGDRELIVTPYLMPANTDTKFFWSLTRNIYRFTPVNLVENLNRAHTTDEFIRANEFVREPLFFVSLILNADDVAGRKGENVD
ncbi:hypothetical protein N7462_007407 [Penicillium macrosclerotiorum]|uniref:uncharacterized protein n=1 Tax=Penicillium macrosclerotiorum TaxID=303699 RepID=UPI00254738D8|nr:uncharacterized protein N7462_007407 [Penicillium macrosclerotiorum]KAJ5679163.1 hypothetical protein N7462_007407 [Penicillium macrosclerotiorum]